jgi:hypothetical protein
MYEPDIIYAGVNLKFSVTLEDYDNSTYTLSYVLINSDNKYTFDATAETGTTYGYEVEVSSSQTSLWTSGTYTLYGYVSDSSGNKYEVACKTVEIKPDVISATTLDNRSHAKKVLDAIEAVMENRASIDQQAYVLNGLRLDRTPLEDLIKLRDRYKKEYENEIAAQKMLSGENTGRRVLVRFVG